MPRLSTPGLRTTPPFVNINNNFLEKYVKKLLLACSVLLVCSACAPYKPAPNEQARRLADDETGSNMIQSRNAKTAVNTLTPEEAAEITRNAGKSIPRPGG